MDETCIIEANILTDGVPDGFYNDCRILASGDIDELAEYRSKLINKGFKGELVIQTNTYYGWGNLTRIQQVELSRYEGELYTKHDMDMLLKVKMKILYQISSTITLLESSRIICNNAEKENINTTINILKKKRVDELVVRLMNAD